jgi:hypothetical protein
VFHGLSFKQQKKMLKKYPTISRHGTHLNFHNMEYKNAFVNVLCKKYFEGQYTPINLGLQGCGNRGSIKELYMYPEINWNLAKEIIVIYAPSGIERFDFVNDTSQSHEHFNFKCMWPNPQGLDPSPKRDLWDAYSKIIYSEKFCIIEQILHVQELMTWCKLNNAKLVVTPGFDRRYDKDYFREVLKHRVERRDNEEFVKASVPILYRNDDDRTNLLELFPWHLMFRPEGHATIIDLSMSKEKNLENTNEFYIQFLGKGSSDGWITPCSHPSQKSHDLFAQHLYTHIISY